MAEQAYLHPTLRNLAPDLEAQGLKLDELAQEVIEDYKNDRMARSEWTRMHAEWLEVYYQTDAPKSLRNFRGASFDSLPILAEATHQYHTRAYNAMFAPRRLVNAYPTGRVSQADVERSLRVSLHMTHQLTVKDPSYKRGKDKLLLALPIDGSVFTKTWRDPVYKMNRVSNVRAIDLMIPYGSGPRKLEDINRKTELITIPVNNTRILARPDVGYFTEPAESYRNVWDYKEAPDISVERATGINPDTAEKEPDALLLESP